MTRSDRPFPHWVDAVTISDEILDAVLEEWPSPADARWTRFGNDNERKYGGSDRTMWGPTTRQVLDMLVVDAAPELSELTGIPNLTGSTYGGGLHMIPPGGYLGVHTDFNRHPTSHLYRRLNLLIFLNRDAESWGGGGDLILGRPERERIVPSFGTSVLFATSDESWHGHPDPTPPGAWRKSLAVYYFSPEPYDGYDKQHSTVFA